MIVRRRLPLCDLSLWRIQSLYNKAEFPRSLALTKRGIITQKVSPTEARIGLLSYYLINKAV